MKKTVLFSVLIALAMFTYAQKGKGKETKAEGYLFKTVKENPITSIKNQAKSGTCWSFSGLALLESELLRTGKGEYDLSEMFIVRHAYEEKMDKYIRYHGKHNFSSGGAFHDVINMIKKYGIVPNEVYEGLEYGEKLHMHQELDAVLAALANVYSSSKKTSTAWRKATNGVLDAYLGILPTDFEYKGEKYTAESFAKSLDLNLDDYIEVGSFTHHPFYEKFIIELPDNWAQEEIYNVSLDELMKLLDTALEKGYTVGWSADVSEKGFSWRNGVAIIPDEEKSDLTGSEQEKWEKLSDAEKAELLYNFDKPVKEKSINQENRQLGFDNFETTDDHGMLIYGIAKDQNGNTFYLVKNSWGEKQKYKGMFYASEAFVRAKTISFMLNKSSLDSSMQSKLKLK